MNEVAEGIWHWTAFHDNIKQQVHSHWVPGARTVIDPKLPVDGELDPERIVLSNRHHLRDALELRVEPILAPRAGLHEFERDGPDVTPYSPGDEVAPGITAHEMGAIAPDDTVLHLAYGAGALLFADAIIRWEGDIAFVPDFLMDEPEKVKAETADRLRDLLGLDFDHLLFAHGEPLVGGGRRALEEFITWPARSAGRRRGRGPCSPRARAGG